MHSPALLPPPRSVRTCFITAGIAASALLLVAHAPQSLAAQSIWAGQNADRVVTLEVLLPKFDRAGQALTNEGATVFVSLRVRVWDQISIAAEIPWAAYDFGGSTSRTRGNEYIGVQIGAADSPVFGELGIRRSSVSARNSAANNAIFTDLDRWEAFVEHIVPITGALNYRHRSNSGVVVRLRAGPSFWIGQDGRDSEVLINYSGQVGYEVPKISLLGGITGRAIATEESLIGGGRTLHQLGAAVALGLGRLWPGMHVRIPVGSTMNQVLDFVVGFNVAIEIG